MKLKFIINHAPNFVKTDKGVFDIADLDTQDFLEYCHQFKIALANNRARRQLLKEPKSEVKR